MKRFFKDPAPVQAEEEVTDLFDQATLSEDAPPRPDLVPMAPMPQPAVQDEPPEEPRIEWFDIEIEGVPEFQEIDPREGGPNIYIWKLSREPERGWATRFDNEAVPRSPFHPVEVRGDALILRSLEGQLRDYAMQTKQRVARTNARFREIDLPRLEMDRETVQHRLEEKAEREKRAREEAEALDLG
jgi:hypothetical protein